MGRRRCCCTGCWEWEDRFQRANIGPKWDEISGNWAMHQTVGGTYYVHESGSVNALLIMSFDAQPKPMQHRVTLSLSTGLAVGAQPRAIVNYADSSNYMFAEWTKTDVSNNGVIITF